MSKKLWDVYAWVGTGDIKIHKSGVTLKEAEKAKGKWISKSPKHEAFIALHEDRPLLKDLTEPKKTSKKSSSKKDATKKADSKKKAKTHKKSEKAGKAKK